MLRPTFALTKTVPITIYRKTQGEFVEGEWVEGTFAEVTLDINIQPVKPDELFLFPEAERSKEWYKGYCADEIRTEKQGDSGWGADEFIWQGDRYRVMKVQNYAMGTLNHWKFWAARFELTPN